MPSLNEGGISGEVRVAIGGQALPDGQDLRRGRNRICDGSCAVRAGDSEAEMGGARAGAGGVLMVAYCCPTASLTSRSVVPTPS